MEKLVALTRWVWFEDAFVCRIAEVRGTAVPEGLRGRLGLVHPPDQIVAQNFLGRASELAHLLGGMLNGPEPLEVEGGVKVPGAIGALSQLRGGSGQGDASLILYYDVVYANGKTDDPRQTWRLRDLPTELRDLANALNHDVDAYVQDWLNRQPAGNPAGSWREGGRVMRAG